MPTCEPPVSAEQIDQWIASALDCIEGNLFEYRDTYPVGNESGTGYEPHPLADGWGAGYWPGMLWIAYEYTGDDRFRRVAEWQLPAFADRLDSGGPAENHHDLGLLYLHSALATHDATGSQHAQSLAIKAADQLASRFHERIGIIQSWGDPRPPSDEVRVIVDSLINLPLLYRASIVTGDTRYAERAETHADRVATHLVQEDGSTRHTILFDPETGDPLRVEGENGYADDSRWSRGLAWAIYGFGLSYRFTGNDRFLTIASRNADHFLEHLPEDHVPPWDFDAPDGDEIRDSSAAAIAAAGLQEVVSHLPLTNPNRRRFENAALSILQSLATEYRFTDPESNALLAEGTGHRHKGEFDEPIIYGDFYYVQSLIRAATDWLPHEARAGHRRAVGKRWASADYGRRPPSAVDGGLRGSTDRTHRVL